MPAGLFDPKSTPTRSVWGTAKRFLPVAAKDSVMRYMLCADRESRKALRRAQEQRGDDPVPVRLRALGGKTFWIRPGAGDHWQVRESVFFDDDAAPPRVQAPKLILDVGANIGLSMALFAERFPSARIVGIEPEPTNAALCRRNMESWADRCEVIEAAAWPEDGRLTLAEDIETGSMAHIGPGSREVKACSLTTVLKSRGPVVAVDYLKMDIEGAERELLTHQTQWAEWVGCISVEVHPPYTVEACAGDLEQLGYEISDEGSFQRGVGHPRVVGYRSI